ncbi:MAG: hypothetical protein Q7R66_19595 [Undibacterium sp.]|uniref:hypothetical protein n=1 Tax=Undibacterium sp. TaxID=1914977 RepID=UPI002717893F|nr:hypothetical protein [Undibacterium sp.]MDO8654381.1 hypothetical protein [Undibacterium sp.]
MSLFVAGEFYWTGPGIFSSPLALFNAWQADLLRLRIRADFSTVDNAAKKLRANARAAGKPSVNIVSVQEGQLHRRCKMAANES